MVDVVLGENPKCKRPLVQEKAEHEDHANHGVGKLERFVVLVLYETDGGHEKEHGPNPDNGAVEQTYEKQSLHAKRLLSCQIFLDLNPLHILPFWIKRSPECFLYLELQV